MVSFFFNPNEAILDEMTGQIASPFWGHDFLAI
jgi:hypothetical protein